MARLRALLAVCALLWGGAAARCEWDVDADVDADLHEDSLAAGARYLSPGPRAEDAEGCRAACCARPDCDAALLGLAADAAPRCMLVHCGAAGCALRPRGNFTAFRRRAAGRSAETPEDKEMKHVTNQSVCVLQVEVGSCRAAFPRFFFDSANQSCRSFVYGGCDANGNNFETKEECEATCSTTGASTPPVKAPRMAPAFSAGVSPDAEGAAQSVPAAEASTNQEKVMSADAFAERCGAEPQVGPCRAAFQRWFYHKDTKNCRPFIYGGCRGNHNNYNSQDSCMAACSVSVLPSSKKNDDEELPPEYKDSCSLTSDPGPCRAAFSMFFFDALSSRCRPFVYGGCRGNANRYGSLEECERSCMDGSFEGRGRARSRWTAAVFLFLSLASLSVLLLVAFVVMVMKRKRESPPSPSDKEELLPDSDDLTVHSLTPPHSPPPI